MSGWTYLLVSYHYKDQTQRVGLVQIGYPHNCIECSLFCHDKSVKGAHCGVKQQSLTHSLTRPHSRYQYGQLHVVISNHSVEDIPVSTVGGVASPIFCYAQRVPK